MIRPDQNHPTQQSRLLSERQWEDGWDGHALSQMRRMAALPLSKKIEWLEQSQRLFQSQQTTALRPIPAKDRAPR